MSLDLEHRAFNLDAIARRRLTGNREVGIFDGDVVLQRNRARYSKEDQPGARGFQGAAQGSSSAVCQAGDKEDPAPPTSSGGRTEAFSTRIGSLGKDRMARQAEEEQPS
jgi:hypothetical protein